MGSSDESGPVLALNRVEIPVANEDNSTIPLLLFNGTSTPSSRIDPNSSEIPLHQPPCEWILYSEIAHSRYINFVLTHNSGEQC